MTHDDVARLINDLHTAWYSALVRYAARLTGSIEVAEDLVQNSFLALCDELLRGIKIHSPKAWTFRVVRRQVNRELYHNKDRGIAVESIDRFDTPDAAEAAFPVLWVDANDEPDELSRYLGYLSPREEEVILMRLEGYRYAEIAETLCVSRETVKTLLARAMKKIRAVRNEGATWNSEWKDVGRRSSTTRQ